MFWKKKEKINVEDYDNVVMIDDEFHYVDDETDDYIRKLRLKILQLENELKAIKPILVNTHYDPPVSADCVNCRFVVKSAYDNLPIGCRKNMVCKSFESNNKED